MVHSFNVQAAGDFPAVLEKVLEEEKLISDESLTVEDVNNYLDRISQLNTMWD